MEPKSFASPSPVLLEAVSSLSTKVALRSLSEILIAGVPVAPPAVSPFRSIEVKSSLPVTVMFSNLSEETTKLSREVLPVTVRSPSNLAPVAVPALQVRSTVKASRSVLAFTSNSVAFAPVTVIVTKSVLPSMSILPATSAAIVRSVRFPFEVTSNVFKNPSTSTVSKLEI